MFEKYQEYLFSVHKHPYHSLLNVGSNEQHYIFRKGSTGLSIFRDNATRPEDVRWEVGFIYFNEGDEYDLTYNGKYGDSVARYLTTEEVCKLIDNLIK